MSTTVSAMTAHPPVDYAHLPGEEHNPLMESTLHSQWVVALLGSATTTLQGSGHLVCGNLPFDLGDGGPYLAPDLMVLPGAAGEQFSLYRLGPNHPVPSVYIEVLSPSNTRNQLDRRARRLIAIGVEELYELDPWADTIERIDVAGEDVVRTNAIGSASRGMALAFAKVDGQLGLCCPAGRMVRAGDNPLAWLEEEMRRADAADARAERSRVEAEQSQVAADEARRRAEAAERELEELRRQVDGANDGAGP
jgi:Putative restriction endonuclease